MLYMGSLAAYQKAALPQNFVKSFFMSSPFLISISAIGIVFKKAPLNLSSRRTSISSPAPFDRRRWRGAGLSAEQ